MILAIRTDSMDAVIALADKEKQIASRSWSPGRKLSEELLTAIEQLLHENNSRLSELSGIIVFEGPGSFTSLRIGGTVANTLAYSLGIPIAGTMGDDWIATGLENLKTAKLGEFVFPKYGAEANVTKPKK